jgi:hypothetical protein
MNRLLHAAIVLATLANFAMWQIYFIFGVVIPVLTVPKHPEVFFPLYVRIAHSGLATLLVMHWPQKKPTYRFVFA